MVPGVGRLANSVRPLPPKKIELVESHAMPDHLHLILISHQVQCFPHRGVLEGEVGDSDPPTPDGPEQGLYRQALLEHRVFCEYWGLG